MIDLPPDIIFGGAGSFKPATGGSRQDCVAAQPARASGVGTPEFNASQGLQAMLYILHCERSRTQRGAKIPSPLVYSSNKAGASRSFLSAPIYSAATAPSTTR